MRGRPAETGKRAQQVPRTTAHVTSVCTDNDSDDAVHSVSGGARSLGPETGLEMAWSGDVDGGRAHVRGMGLRERRTRRWWKKRRRVMPAHLVCAREGGWLWARGEMSRERLERVFLLSFVSATARLLEGERCGKDARGVGFTNASCGGWPWHGRKFEFLPALHVRVFETLWA